MIAGLLKFCISTSFAAFFLLTPLSTGAQAATPLETACEKFSSFDQNKDNQVEISSLRPIIQSAKTGPRVLMLVEERILKNSAAHGDLMPHLKRWSADIESEGCRGEVISVALAKSKMHQDGRYVLALRDFLRAVDSQAKISGVVLVGHFPDASIVRAVNWRKKDDDITLHKKSGQPQKYKDAHLLSWHPSLVAAKADIVLADLNGSWDKVYIQKKTDLAAITAIYDGKIPEEGGNFIDLEEKTEEVEDVFYVADGKLEITKRFPPKNGRTAATIKLDASIRNHECAPNEAKLPNGIAIPDIAVSRIDARGVAYSPRSKIVGTNGAQLLDKSGKPQAVTFSSKKAVPNWSDEIWQHDEKLERKLLAEYFDRNHDYRKGTAQVAWRPASIAHELGSGYRVMLRASQRWIESDPKLRDIRGHASLVDFVKWMEYPAVLRTVRAHSFPQGSQFEKVEYQKIEECVKGQIWSWSPKGNQLIPSLEAASGKGMLNWYLLRTLYENKQVANTPVFYHHTGCNSITPPWVEKFPYDHPRYGERQAAEALLFFGNGLALVGRAKVYFDEPSGFAEELAKGKTFGQAWAKNFSIDSQNPDIHNVSRKKAYFWSLLGDWTLRLSSGAPNRL